MSKALSLVCLVASAAIGVVIMVLNANFWAGIGTQDRARVAFAVGALALDCMKVTLLPLAAVAADRQLRTYVVTAVSMWLLLTSFSLYSAWSFAQRNSGAGAAELVMLDAELKEKQLQLRQAMGRLEALPQHRDAGLTTIEIKALEADRKFQLSRGCFQAQVQTRSFCAGHRRLAAEHDVAVLAAGLDKQVQGLRSDIRELEAKVNHRRFGNPASAVERALHWAEGDGWILVNAFIIAVLEIAAGVGVYLALRLQMIAPRERSDLSPRSHWQSVPRSPERRSGNGAPGPGVRKGRLGLAKKEPAHE